MLLCMFLVRYDYAESKIMGILLYYVLLVVYEGVSSLPEMVTAAPGDAAPSGIRRR